jgi:hypothetical protein
MGDWYVRPAILALAAVSLTSSRMLRRAEMWFALAALVACRIAADWPLADNHIYLLGYWCLAAALGLRATQPPAVLATSARHLIGLAFACAVVWKLMLSPDFTDGRFFRVTLLSDPRFVTAAQWIGGLSNTEVEANQRALEPLPEGAERLEPLPVAAPIRLQRFATIATWGVVLLEAAVGVLMLAPSGARVEWARHAALLVFCLTTYAFAPVAGFGWLLLVMGTAQIKLQEAWLRHVYVAAFVVVLFYSEVPWSGWMLRLSGAQ